MMHDRRERWNPAFLWSLEDADKGRFALPEEKGNEAVSLRPFLNNLEGIGCSVDLRHPLDAGWLPHQKEAVPRSQDAKLPRGLVPFGKGFSLAALTTTLLMPPSTKIQTRAGFPCF